MLQNVNEGLNAFSEVYLSKKYFLRDVPELRVFLALRVYFVSSHVFLSL